MGVYGGLISRAVKEAGTKQTAAPVRNVRTPVTPTRIAADAPRVTIPTTPSRPDAARVQTPEAPRRPTGQYVSGKKHPATRHIV